MIAFRPIPRPCQSHSLNNSPHRHSRRTVARRLTTKASNDVTDRDVDHSLRSSSQFFARLQEQVRAEVQERGQEEGKRRGKQSTAVGQYKL